MSQATDGSYRDDPFDTLWTVFGVRQDALVEPDHTITEEVWATLGAPEPGVRTPPPRLGDDEDLELGEELGRGAMGVVRAATQRSLDRQVAIKELQVGTGPHHEAQLVREARITGLLEHPNIPPVHALIERDGRPALVMKRIRGVPWRAVLTDADHPAWRDAGLDDLPLPWRHARVAAALCDALACAHANGIVHRDVKPANVMLGAFGEILLMDWGLAIDWEELGAQPTPRAVVGTPAYMAPEMVDGLADPRTDVYLVGAVLHHALCGQPLRSGSSVYQVLGSVWNARPFELPPDLPSPLAAIVRRATEPRPEARYPDARHLRAALAEALEQRAALALADEARASLVRAEGASPEQRGRWLAEARFGFRQAARHVDDANVRVGLSEATTALARHEVAAGRIDSALALLDEVEDEDQTLRGEVASLRERARRQQELQQLAADLDPSVAAWWRIRYLTGVAGLMTGLGVVVSWASSLPAGAGYRVAIWGSGNAAVFTLMGMVLWRRRLFVNTYNRTVMLLVAVACGGVFLGRTLAARLGTPVGSALVQDLVLLASLAAVVGVVTARWMLIVALACVGAAIAAAWLPEHGSAIIGATVLVSGGVAIGGMRAAAGPRPT
ncbi:MAG: protein kinase [Alphaproteobacteria bacterium]|nr:protein kinase [Alphaproteobacteria bacterium]